MGKGKAAKSRFSSLDVRAMATSLEPMIAGYRITNVYDANPRTYILKLSKPEAPKLLLLLESGVRFHLTRYARDKEGTPSGFTMKLRKHLKGKRIEQLLQPGADRVLVVACGSGEARHHLIVELYDKGNVVLTDCSHTILTLLRSSKHDSEAMLLPSPSVPSLPRAFFRAVFEPFHRRA